MRAARTSARVVVGFGLAMAALLVVATARSAAQTGEKPTREAATPPPRSAVVDQIQEPRLSLAHDEIEVMRAQVDLRRELTKNGEKRLEQARKWKTHFEALLRDGKVTEDRLLAATDDVLMMEAHVAAERTELKMAELRLKQVGRRVAYGEMPDTSDLRTLEIYNRLQSIELSIDRLQHEVGRLRREQPNAKR